MKTFNTIIIGAGQAGLSTSFYLTQKGINHIILEKGKIAEDWQKHRWDNFHLLTPNFMTKLPGFSYASKKNNDYASKEEIIKFLKDYAKSFNAPVRENTEVKLVTKKNDIFLVKTSNGVYKAKNVVIAIGWFHKPKIPEISKVIPQKILQIHSSEYKNSREIPKGAILVVGTGNSGIQIAEDLNQSKRKVYLSVGKHRIFPRNYRGKDFIEWSEFLGTLDRPATQATSEIKNLPPLALFGKHETVNLRKLGKSGVILLGHLTEFSNNEFHFANDLVETIEIGENNAINFKKIVDKYIIEHKLNAPKEKRVSKTYFIPKLITELKSENIKTIVWATGFQRDFSFLNLPVFDKDDQPIHENGVSKIKGLYFIGLAWLSKYKSFFILGVGEDAKYLASKIH